MSRKLTHHVALSVVSPTTLTPFLYQTRTLRFTNYIDRGRLTYKKSLSRPFSSAHNLRNLKGENVGQEEAAKKTTWSPVISNSEPTSRRSKRTSESGDPTSSSAPFDSIQDSNRRENVVRFIDEDIVASRTNTNSLKEHRRRVVTQAHGYDQQATDFGNFSEGIDFDEDVDENWIGGKDEISELTRSRPLGESTITDSERYAFQKIFKDIFGKTQNAGAVNAGIDSVTMPLDSETVKSAHGEMRAKAQKLSRWEMEEVVNKYPAPLRAAAARAMGLGQPERDGEEEALDREPDLDLERLEALREPERNRVEAMMKDANTDFELWDIMEQEVFSLIPKLGLEGIAPTSTSAKSKPRKKKSQAKKGDQAHIDPTSSPQMPYFSANENGISLLALYGPLYPSYLLFGLRLLDRHFVKSSPLTLALLPKIKSLGVLSHVLGASSQLYNELVQVYRYRFDDYRGILRLLTEMEHSGIEFDQETLEIVKDIQRMHLSVRKGEKGEVVQALWTFPEFAPNQFKIWIDKITADLKSRELSQRITVTY